jgi:hypothetical protein
MHILKAFWQELSYLNIHILLLEVVEVNIKLVLHFLRTFSKIQPQVFSILNQEIFREIE